jgi:hypothetical protein
MKALLQQLGTGLYFKGPDSWTPDPLEAYDFKSSVNARTYCLDRGIPNAQIVLKFEVDKYDIILPAQYVPPGEDSATTGTGVSPQ